ncbi:MAG: sigma-54 dependent transcriptional regulator [Proteobacteria bacterium]|nr:sigma-54 dependent transcriptional regulator [Pseudomonadota bacterium]MBU4381503.1 sigma-54 dependent transcriptional regulator [Pseudomonadota bacterium]MCG2766490.1 sigma-54 dependent transcriptional regulator [Desulfarculaceae bacterium]
MSQSKILHKARVAIIDDEPITRREIQRGLAKHLHTVEIFENGESALKKMATDPFDLVFCDLRLPGMNGLDVVREVKAHHPITEVIVFTGYGSIDTAVEAIQAGAFHFLTKPVKINELIALATRALEKVALIHERDVLKKSLAAYSRQQYIIGHSQAMQDVLSVVKKVCSLNCNVLIQGESGTGKELVARAIHFLGSRRENPFIAFSCGGFSEELIANELFGHEKGAFTGALNTKIGLLESADKGTLFLDEIEIMPSSMQVKLLRFIQERSLIRVGGTRPIPLDVRIIAAGNKNLKKVTDENRFREDLYYRLNVVLIDLPPLRDRRSDIPLLINHFITKHNQRFGQSVSSVDPEVIDIFNQYPFPGNVRELENIIERAIALSDDKTITPADLPDDLFNFSIENMKPQNRRSLQDQEKEYIRRVLIETNYNKGKAAQILKVPRTTLWRKIKLYSLDTPTK